MRHFYKRTKAIMTAALIVLTMTAHAAFVRNLPAEIKQPDGVTLHEFASGDEHYNWLHDKENFTIVKNTATGYYVYAAKENGLLVATNYVVGKVNPAQVGLTPGLLDDESVIKEKVAQSIANRKPKGATTRNNASVATPQMAVRPGTGTYNNVVVYIQFSDQTTEEWSVPRTTGEAVFNGTGMVSVKDFYNEVSAGKLNVNATFYPQTTGTYPISYTDSHPRTYYELSTPDGYGSDPGGSAPREHLLLKNAIDYVSSQIPSSLNIDGNNDGFVDNVTFVIKGYTDGWSELLWPHRWQLFSQTAMIGTKQVYDYNIVFGSSLGAGVISHELFHSFGAPDLYEYSAWNNVSDAVGAWDLMASEDWNTPQHMGAYMKQRYGTWVSSIPEITTTGTYTLQPVSTNSLASYKIKLANSTDYIVLEYRKKEGKYESQLPASGLIVSMINESGNNASGPVNEIYIFRKDGTFTGGGSVYNAAFSADNGLTAFSDQTNPPCFKSDGTPCGLAAFGISNVSTAGSTISFNYTSPTSNTCTTPAWDATIAYTTGQEVSYNGIKYKANWWTQNNRPDQNSGAAGSGQPWLVEGPCGGGTTNVAPVVNITSPANNSSFASGSTVTIDATASDADGSVARVDFLDVNNNVVFSDNAAPYEYVTASLAVGTYTYKAIAYDNLSAVSNTATVSFTINTPGNVPTITITSPTNGQQIYEYPSTAAPITVTVSTNNTTVQIDSVLFIVVETICDGPGCSSVRRFTVKTAPFTLNYQSVLNHNGFTQINAIAFSGNTASDQSTVTIGVFPLPELAIVSPLDNSSVLPTATSIPVDVTVNTDKLPIDSVVYTIYDTRTTGMNGYTTTRTFTVTAAPYDLTLPVISGVTYTKISAVAYGMGGKFSETQSVTVNYNYAPVVTVTAPLPQYNNNNIVYVVGSTITVSANATDQDGTVVKVEISEGANAPVVLTAPPYTATFTNLPAPAPDGSIYFNVKVYDNKGATTTALIVAYIDRAPIISITSPANNTTVTAGSTINVTTLAQDSDGAVAKVEFFNGATKLGESTTAPYSFTISNAVAGTYTLTAKATDDLGIANTSTAVIVNVSGGTCTVAAWNSTTAYTVGQRASKNGTVYEAKWWTQNEDPITHSGQYDSWKVIGACSARLSDAETLSAVTLAPVPFDDELFINVQDAQAHIELYSQIGMKVAEVDGNQIVSLNTVNLSSGLYVCKVFVNGQSKSFTVIKR